MTRVFVGGPLRRKSSRALLDRLVTGLSHPRIRLFAPHRDIGVIDLEAEDLSSLGRNFAELARCDVGVFVVEREGTGTGVELGYLCGLVAAGRSDAKIVCLARPGTTRKRDLMVEYSVGEFGVMATSLRQACQAVLRFSGVHRRK